MKKIKLGLIGCGLAARNLHIPALEKLKNKFEIAVVCNHTEKKAREVSEMLGGVPYVLDYNDVLNNPEIDAVDIALPIELNYKVALDAVGANKHIFLEKPVAATLDEARELVKLEENYEKVTMVAENFRYRKVYKKVRELVGKGEIGKLNSFQWNIFYGINKNEGFADTKWRQNNKYPGGFMLDAGVHYIAAVRQMLGGILTVTAKTGMVNPEIGTNDLLNIQFETENGITGTLNIHYSVTGFWEDRILLFGSEGTLVVRENNIEIFNKNGKAGEEDFPDDYGFTEEFEDFYEAIVNSKEIGSSFAEGYKDLSLVLASLYSHDDRKIIEF